MVSHIDDVDEETLEFATYAAALARQWWPLAAKCSSERALEDVLRCHCNAFAVLLPTPALAHHKRPAMAGLGTRHGLAKEIGLAICPKAAFVLVRRKRLRAGAPAARPGTQRRGPRDRAHRCR